MCQGKGQVAKTPPLDRKAIAAGERESDDAA